MPTSLQLRLTLGQLGPNLAHLGCIVASSWRPKSAFRVGGFAFLVISVTCVSRRLRWLQDGLQSPPRGPKMTPRGSKRASRGPKTSSGRAQDDPKTAPSRLQAASKSLPSRIQNHLLSEPLSRGAREAPKALRGSPRGPTDLPGGPKKAPKRPPQSPQEAPKLHPSTTLTLHFQAFDRLVALTTFIFRARAVSISSGTARMHETGAAVIRRQAF